MPNPQELVISTELYDTLKNDGFNDTVQVVIPGSVSVAGSGFYIQTALLTIGSAQSIAESRVQTSRDTSKDFIVTSPFSVGDSVSVNGFTRTGNLGAYQIYCSVTHISTTQVQVQAFIVNPYGSTLTGQSGNETFTFKIRTYKAPF